MRTRSLLLGVVIALLLIISLPTWATGYSFTARQGFDAWVDEGNPNTVQGTSTMVYITNSGSDYPNGGSGWTICPVWQWNLDLSEGETIQAVSSATFQFTTAWGIPAGTPFRFYRLAQPFKEDTVTWNNRPIRDSSTYVEWTWDGGLIKSIDVSPLLRNNGGLHTFGIVCCPAPSTGWAGGYLAYTREDGYWGPTASRLSAAYTAAQPAELALSGNVRRGQNLPVTFTCTPNVPNLFNGLNDEANFPAASTTVSLAFTEPVVITRVKVFYFNDNALSYNGGKDVTSAVYDNGTLVSTSNTARTNALCPYYLVDTAGGYLLGNESTCYFATPATGDRLDLVITKQPSAYQTCIREVQVWGLPADMTGSRAEYALDYSVTDNTNASLQASWSTPPANTDYIRVRYRAVGSSVWSAQCFAPSQTSGLVLGLEPGKSYEVNVHAIGVTSGGTAVTSTVTLPGITEVRTLADMFGTNFYPLDQNQADAAQNAINMLDMMRDAHIKHVRWYAGSPDVARYFAEWGIALLPMGGSDRMADLRDGGVWMSQTTNEPECAGLSPASMVTQNYTPNYSRMTQFSTGQLLTIPDGAGELLGPGAEYIDQLYNLLGASKISVIDIHPYPKTSGLAPVGGYAPSPEILFGHLASLKSVLAAHNDANKPIIVSEIGHTTKGGDPFLGQSSPEQQAQRLVRDNIILAKEGVKRVYTYAFQDRSSNPDDSESGFGMVNYDGTAKPAYDAYRYMATLLGPTTFDAVQSDVTAPVYGMRFHRADGTHVTALWNCGGASNVAIDYTGNGVTEIRDLYGVSVPVPAQGRPLALTESVCYVISTNPLTISAPVTGQLQLTLTPGIPTAAPGGTLTYTAAVSHNFATAREVQVHVLSPFTQQVIYSPVYTVQPNTTQNITMQMPVPAGAAIRLWTWDSPCTYRPVGATAWDGYVTRSLYLNVAQ